MMDSQGKKGLVFPGIWAYDFLGPCGSFRRKNKKHPPFLGAGV